MADPSDDTLMLRYREGDAAAFGQLYARHSGPVYAFIAWRSPRRDWVDEIVQDSWASLIQARDRYQAQGNFRTWLFQIARNRLTDYIRQQGRTVLATELESAQGGDDEGSVFQALVDEGQAQHSPSAQLSQRQAHESLHAAIRALPADQREALVLQQFSGMSLEEIGQVVSAPVETVKSRLRYAMRKLRAQLEPAMLDAERA